MSRIAEFPLACLEERFELLLRQKRLGALEMELKQWLDEATPTEFIVLLARYEAALSRHHD